ncbi:hypothetical protein FOA52_000824 [Chlamydomonas sp. UWO 241]|nr:hypothetical protein FOA52_000824 [Chlamydomonas sp. UWO 241]
MSAAACMCVRVQLSGGRQLQALGLQAAGSSAAGVRAHHALTEACHGVSGSGCAEAAGAARARMHAGAWPHALLGLGLAAPTGVYPPAAARWHSSSSSRQVAGPAGPSGRTTDRGFLDFVDGGRTNAERGSSNTDAAAGLEDGKDGGPRPRGGVGAAVRRPRGHRPWVAGEGAKLPNWLHILIRKREVRDAVERVTRPPPPRARHQGCGRRLPPAPAELTSHIMGARGVRELSELVERHSPGGEFATRPLSHVHVTALYRQGAWLVSQRWRSRSAEHADGGGGSGGHGAADAVGGGGGSGGRAEWDTAVEALAERLATRLFQVLDKMDMRGVAQVVWSMGKMRLRLDPVLRDALQTHLATAVVVPLPDALPSTASSNATAASDSGGRQRGERRARVPRVATATPSELVDLVVGLSWLRVRLTSTEPPRHARDAAAGGHAREPAGWQPLLSAVASAAHARALGTPRLPVLLPALARAHVHASTDARVVDALACAFLDCLPQLASWADARDLSQDSPGHKHDSPNHTRHSHDRHGRHDSSTEDHLTRLLAGAPSETGTGTGAEKAHDMVPVQPSGSTGGPDPLRALAACVSGLAGMGVASPRVAAAAAGAVRQCLLEQQEQQEQQQREQQKQRGQQPEQQQHQHEGSGSSDSADSAVDTAAPARSQTPDARPPLHPTFAYMEDELLQRTSGGGSDGAGTGKATGPLHPFAHVDMGALLEEDDPGGISAAVGAAGAASAAAAAAAQASPQLQGDNITHVAAGTRHGDALWHVTAAPRDGGLYARGDLLRALNGWGVLDEELQRLLSPEQHNS